MPSNQSGSIFSINIPYPHDALLSKIRYVKNEVKKKNSAATDKNICTADNMAVNERNLEADITGMIHDIGIPAHIKGYQYLRDSIMLSVKDRDVINSITKILYPTIAKMYQTTSSRTYIFVCRSRIFLFHFIFYISYFA